MVGNFHALQSFNNRRRRTYRKVARGDIQTGWLLSIAEFQLILDLAQAIGRVHILQEESELNTAADRPAPCRPGPG